MAARMDFCPHGREAGSHGTANCPHGLNFARTNRKMAARNDLLPHGTGICPHRSVSGLREAIFARTKRFEGCTTDFCHPVSVEPSSLKKDSAASPANPRELNRQKSAPFASAIPSALSLRESWTGRSRRAGAARRWYRFQNWSATAARRTAGVRARVPARRACPAPRDRG